MFYAVEMLEMF